MKPLLASSPFTLRSRPELQLAAIVLQIFIRGEEGTPDKLVESYKFVVEYVDGDARMRIAEQETGTSTSAFVETTSVESMKRTFQVPPLGVYGSARPAPHAPGPCAGHDSKPYQPYEHFWATTRAVFGQLPAALHGR